MRFIAEISAEDAITIFIGNYKESEEISPQSEEKPPQWKPASEPPEDEGLVPVVTSKGVRMFSRAINGKFLDDVEWWLPMPQIPKSNGKV